MTATYCKFKQIYSIFFIGVLFASCGGNKNIDVSDIPVDVKIERFDRDFNQMSQKPMAQQAIALQKKYGNFYTDYVGQVLEVGNPNDTAYFNTLRQIFANNAYRDLKHDVDAVFPGDMEKQNGELTDAFRRIKYYYPQKNLPKVYAYFSLNEKQILDFSNKYAGKNLNEQMRNIPPVSLVLADGTVYAQNGKIESINGQINTATGSVSLRATFPNPTSILKSGGSASVRIPQNVKDVILIPQKSTTDLQGKKFVYVLGDSAKVINTPVEVMQNTKGKFYVVTKGIKAGDKIVLEGFQSLRDGTKIKPEEKNTDSVYAEIKK